MKGRITDMIRGHIFMASRSAQQRCNRLGVTLGALAFAVASTCAGQSKVFDTGYEIDRLAGPWPSLYWIDNDRLLFAGANSVDMEAAIRAKDPNRARLLQKLYLWDATTTSAKLYADAKDLCVAGGVVRYTLRMGAAGKTIERIGLFGSEKEIENPLTSHGEMSRGAQTVWVRSRHTCKIHTLSELVPLPGKGRRIIVLREGDGYLDSGPLGTKELLDQRSGPILFFHPNRKSPIELPIKIEQGPGDPRYSPYLRAYVSRPRPKSSDPTHVTSWPRGLPFVVYSFRSTGETSETIVPYGQWGTISQVQPTRAGWIFSGYGEIRPKSGLFLFKDQVRRLDTGQVYEITVSQDGCRAAVGIKNRHLDMGTPIHLRVFEVCTGGR